MVKAKSRVAKPRIACEDCGSNQFPMMGPIEHRSCVDEVGCQRRQSLMGVAPQGSVGEADVDDVGDTEPTVPPVAPGESPTEDMSEDSNAELAELAALGANGASDDATDDYGGLLD